MYRQLKDIRVGKLCEISVYDGRDRYILDILAADHKDQGFINFQFSVDLEGSCCETNELSCEFEYREQLEDLDVPDRITSRWGDNVRYSHLSTRLVRNIYVRQLENDAFPEYDYAGGTVLILVMFEDGTSTQVVYQNYHNGYYAHAVEVTHNNQVIYEEDL